MMAEKFEANFGIKRILKIIKRFLIEMNLKEFKILKPSIFERTYALVFF